ncbi:MAG: hypothetical protein IIX47_07055 [Spirochaetaceae bacterium]|nr:hypothetical protein [Spirochaetaceae bacterium]
MKKLAVVLAALLLACVFVGCGDLSTKALEGTKWQVVSVKDETDISKTPYRYAYVAFEFKADGECSYIRGTSKDVIASTLAYKWDLDESGTSLTIYDTTGAMDGKYDVEYGVKEMTWTQTAPDSWKGQIVKLEKEEN